MSLRATRRPLAGIVDAVVIGAGHSGLAMSHALSARSIDHVVLERGEVANSWRTERWDSLRLLTPNWMSRLPGYCYRGDDPDGYMTVSQVVEFMAGYARHAAAPVVAQAAVTSVESDARGYRVRTNRGDWLCRALVLATGAFNVPVIPRVAEGVPAGVTQVTARDYRNPGRLETGGVLVVGASATGLQLAQEIQASGRPVTLAVGEHVRMPRVYRGRDVQWWMLESGVLDQRIEDTDDPVRARRVPSPQLVGTPERATLDLNVLRTRGIEIVGRLAGIRDGKAQFSGSLRNVCALADLKMNRLLALFDDWAAANGLDGEVGPPERYADTDTGASPRLTLGLGSDVRTIVWATGFRPDYSWLDVPVLDRRGQLRHERGVVDAPGLYVLGLPYLRRRKSSFIHGAEDDVREISGHLAGYLDCTARPRVAGMGG
jgi:putative flavoprotein involved in K+ transport